MFNSFYVYKTPGTIENMKIYDLIFQKSWKWSIYLILNNIQQASEASEFFFLIKDILLIQQFVVCMYLVELGWYESADYELMPAIQSQSDHRYRYPPDLFYCNCKYQNVIQNCHCSALFCTYLVFLIFIQ